MATPIVASMRQKTMVAVMDWRKMSRARFMSFAPMLWATCTEKPAEVAETIPQNSHIVVDTKPMEAVACAPSPPTIDASIYCMRMWVIWASMEGRLSNKVSVTC